MFCIPNRSMCVLISSILDVSLQLQDFVSASAGVEASLCAGLLFFLNLPTFSGEKTSRPEDVKADFFIMSRSGTIEDWPHVRRKI